MKNTASSREQDPLPTTGELVRRVHQEGPPSSLSLSQHVAHIKTAVETTAHCLDPNEAFKLEFYGLTAVLIEQAWKIFTTWADANPPGLGEISGNAFVPWPDNAVHDRASCYQTHSRFLEQFDLHTLNTLRYFFGNYCDRLEKNSDDAADPGARCYRRLVHLFETEAHRFVEPLTPKTLLYRGIGTAALVTWHSLGVIPETYVRQYGKQIPLEELDRLAESCKTLVITLASMELIPLMALTENLQDLPEFFRGSDTRHDLMPLQPKFFRIGQIGSQSMLEITPAAFENVDSPYDFRTGCPALAVQGSSMQHVVGEMFDWVLTLFRKYYYPQLPRFQAVLDRKYKLSTPATSPGSPVPSDTP